MTQQDTLTDRLTITDIAIRDGLGYYAARDRALKGQFGPVKRVEGRLYVIARTTAGKKL
jgi:hypothetical protein